jgi:ribosomal protein S18 acetylase RimI-like enzyme
LFAIAIRESDDKVVGFAQLSDNSTERDCAMNAFHVLGERECYIEMMSVLPEVRGQGIGTRLLQWCETRARECGAQTLTLGVVARNPAKRLYERFGFVDQEEGLFGACVGSEVIFGVFGFPHWGCGGSTMAKNLEALA